MIYNNTVTDSLLGSLFNDTSLAINSKYELDKEEFAPVKFHFIIYVTLLNLAIQGVKKATIVEVIEFLQNHEAEYNIFLDNDGERYLNTVSELANEANFEYYYNKFKKYSFLRTCSENGINIDEIYDINKERHSQDAKIETMTIQQMVNIVDGRFSAIKKKYVIENIEEYVAGTDFAENKERFKESPLMGYSFHSPCMNEIFNGMFGFLLRGAKSGGGKTITSIGDMLQCTITEYYDEKEGKYVKNKSRVGSSLFINTEMDLRKEVDPAIIAYISGVNRKKIVKGKYEGNEEERVDYANKVLKESIVHLVDHPDFDTSSLRSIITDYVVNKEVKFVCFDYVANNGTVAKKIAKDSGIPQREDMVLLALTTVLKQIQKDLGIHLISSVQTNGSEDAMDVPTEACLAGSKGQIRKTDGAYLMLPPKKKELELTKPLIEKWNKKFRKETFGKQILPNNVIHVLKGRGTEYPRYMRLFQRVDFGTGRSIDMFCTDSNLKPLEVVGLKIEYDE